MLMDDPWADIEPPSTADTITARRVDAELPWNFFWARGADGKVLLTLSLDRASVPITGMPRLRDIEVTLGHPDELGNQLLVFKLLDPTQQDLFKTLCRDIISAATAMESERLAASVALMRTWRWHHLLRGGRGSLLSAEEQRGLLGELLVLERLLLPHVDALSAVTAWRGPLGAPKDFEIARVGIEAKARRGGATPYISVGSENQLDESGVDQLYLHVAEFDQAPADSPSGMTVADVVDRIEGSLLSVDPNACTSFEALLSAAGYRKEDDYSNFLWIEGATAIYLITGDFPRVALSELRTGVSNVKYSVSLIECAPFETSIDALTRAIGSTEV